MKNVVKFVYLIFVLAWLLVPMTHGDFADAETGEGNTFTAGCFAAPTVPVLRSPDADAQTTDTTITFDWDDPIFVCPDQSALYQFEWYSDGTLTNLLLQSNWFPGSEFTRYTIEAGTYYWRVRARDTQGYTSDFSAARSVTVLAPAPLIGYCPAPRIIEETPSPTIEPTQIPTPSATPEPTNVPLEQPNLILSRSADRTSLELTVQHILAYTHIAYQLMYENAVGPQGAVGEKALIEEEKFSRTFYLGSCSSGGTCTPDTDVHDVEATVTLTKPDGSTVILDYK